MSRKFGRIILHGCSAAVLAVVALNSHALWAEGEHLSFDHQQKPIRVGTPIARDPDLRLQTTGPRMTSFPTIFL